MVEGVSICDGAKASIAARHFDSCKKAIVALEDTELIMRETECIGADNGLEVSGAAAVRAEPLTLTGCQEAVTVGAGDAQHTVTPLADCVATGSTVGAVATCSPGVEFLVTGCSLEDSPVGLDVAPGSSDPYASLPCA